MRDFTNISEKRISAKTFQQGFKDAMNGIGFYEKYEYYDQQGVDDKINYELGRHFYFAAGKTRLKQGRGISGKAIEIYDELRANCTLF